MIKLPRFFLLTSALFACIASLSQAQLLTADTIDSGSYVAFDGYNNGTVLLDGVGLTQTFTAIDSIDTLTFRFISDNSTGSLTNLNVYFSQWDASNTTSQLGYGSIALDAASSWTLDSGYYYFDASFDLSNMGVLTPATTYGFTIVGNADSDAGSYRLSAANGVYADGAGFLHGGVTTFNDLTTGGIGPLSGFAFTADSAGSLNSLTAVPEASTVAVWFAGAFVGGMAFMRVRQRRQQALQRAQA